MVNNYSEKIGLKARWIDENLYFCIMKCNKYTKIILLLISALCSTAVSAGDFAAPKREFRGAWMHTVFQDQYLRKTTEQNKKYICSQLDSLAAAGINCIIFQVRPQSDAFYKSDIEPWSMFLTNNGAAPKPFWDPLEFIIEQAHKRAMELHAWINPYRVTSSKKQQPGKGHLYYSKPERFIRFDGKIYFDPGIPENRNYISTIVEDIVTRYDVDGIHFDDYFYPYPVKGTKFDDSKSYGLYGKGMSLADWRRENVNSLIESLSSKIKSLKPWVRFGVSPFGIWRNSKADKRGSETDGLANYDDLYADVLLWIEKGWVDYLTPQLYWNADHPKASYDVLLKWWNENSFGKHIYIGQSIPVTMGKGAECGTAQSHERLSNKIDATRRASNITGNCWWPAYSLTANEGGILTALKNKHQSKKALMPSYEWLSDEMPETVENVSFDGNMLRWDSAEVHGMTNDPVKFVVYHFDPKSEDFDLENASNIVNITTGHTYKASRSGYYIVTVLNRVNNESLPSEPILLK